MTLTSIDYTREPAGNQISQPVLDSVSPGECSRGQPSESRLRGATRAAHKGRPTPKRRDRQQARRRHMAPEQAAVFDAILTSTRERLELDAERKSLGDGTRLRGHHRRISLISRLGTGEVFIDLDDAFMNQNSHEAVNV
jgi:hypothetical protein